ncbi:MAG: glycosyltransferase [Erysipelotrichaceae bacterium]|nr:glycosyltransferase [Erysipelotrichaceae bacterium]
MCENCDLNKYSVLMTVYKKDNPLYFKMALDSMINQTLKPDEIIIVKDGEITNELEDVICQNKKRGNIIEVQLDKNVGLGKALNEGLKMCKNELVARMDADDISLPERCEKQVRKFKEYPNLDIVGCSVKEFVNEPNNIVGKRDVPSDNMSIRKYAKRRDPFNHPTVMYKKSKVLKYGPYKNYRKNQDTALWIDLLSNNCIAANISEYLLLFRFDESTYKKRKTWINTKLLIQIRWNGFKIKFNSFFDFLIVAISQLAVYVLPINFQKYLYRNFLRS